MLRVVFDTNVLVSALLFGGNPNAVLRLAIKKQLIGLTSSALLAELEDVLLTKFHFSSNIAELILSEWRKSCVIIEPTVTFSVVRADPSDNRVLECAVAGHADAIVSGDHHLQALKTFRGIPILSPTSFLAKHPF